MKSGVGISAKILLFVCVALLAGCKKSTPESPVGPGATSQQHAQQKLPADWEEQQERLRQQDLERRRQEGMEAARKTEERERARREAEQQQQKAMYDWLARAKQLHQDRDKTTRELRYEFSEKLLAFKNSLPPSQRTLSSELQESYNRFVENGVSIPLRPELRGDGLDYIKKRLAVEKQYRHQYQVLLANVPKGVPPGDLHVAQEDQKDIDKVIFGLEAVQPLVAALPTSGSTVAGETRPDSTKPMQPDPRPMPPGDGSNTETPIAKDWKVVADPGPARQPLPEKLPYTELTGIHPSVLVYPPGLTSFLLAGFGHANPAVPGGFESLAAADLRTGKPLGIARDARLRAQTTVLDERPSLSPDGQWIAYYSSTAGAVQVVEVKTSKTKRSLPLSAVSVGLLFPKPTQLLALVYGDPGKSLGKVWEIPGGKLLAEFAIPDGLETNASHVALSPGGRFLAMALSEGGGLPALIHLIDLTTGRDAGRIYPVSRNAKSPAMINALAFSPDGEELAAAVTYTLPNGSPDETITCYKLATGREVSRVTIDRGNRGMLQTPDTTEGLQWFPDQRAWLVYQRYVINRADGKLLQVITGEGDTNAHYATKVLDDRRVLVATHRQRLLVLKVDRPASVPSSDRPPNK